MSKSIDGLYECTIKNCDGVRDLKVADILYKGMITSGYERYKIPWWTDAIYALRKDRGKSPWLRRSDYPDYFTKPTLIAPINLIKWED
jgi:hypothetical protein